MSQIFRTTFRRRNGPTFGVSVFWFASPSFAAGLVSSESLGWSVRSPTEKKTSIKNVKTKVIPISKNVATMSYFSQTWSEGVFNRNKEKCRTSLAWIWHKIILADSKLLIFNSWDGAWSLCQLMCKAALKKKQKVETWNAGCCAYDKMGQTLGRVPSLCTFHPTHSW